ncbi:hypothetical protein IWQ60_008903 [Tieghemiomyces parasiticus]|uniref:ribonuclease H n=1 Tax=Tieghemiomyces parasiticus TaxID=78921 RepID=A0A9W7ZWQ7_9FUNG|nr:hypothetical protein IWQ60_008903 [Tieghemiomyces parasiticus]
MYYGDDYYYYYYETASGEESSDYDYRRSRRPSNNQLGTPQVVYTDGACINNGRAGSCAGVGAYFGDGDVRNISERLKGPVQTNQRAELTAIKRALEVCSRRRPLTVHTDSKYAMNAITVWSVKWQNNGWVNCRGFPVANQDLIKAILALIDDRYKDTIFSYVPAHSGSEGNDMADTLAYNGIWA